MRLCGFRLSLWNDNEMASKRKLAFLPDHCISGEIVDYLGGLKRVRVVSFESLGLQSRAEDDRVIEEATKARLLVLTVDKRFTEDHIPLCRHEGIVKFEVSKPATMLRCLQKFLHMKERHYAWKGVTRLYESSVVIHQHNGFIDTYSL
jgi:hypothetical protein